AYASARSAFFSASSSAAASAARASSSSASTRRTASSAEWMRADAASSTLASRPGNCTAESSARKNASTLSKGTVMVMCLPEHMTSQAGKHFLRQRGERLLRLDVLRGEAQRRLELAARVGDAAGARVRLRQPHARVGVVGHERDRALELARRQR